jgi:transcriptional regulator with XRE-family HTH domain
MAKTQLTSALLAAQKERGLSTASLAKTIGVALSSFTTLLKGKGAPNARTAEKYAAFLGVDAAEIKAMAKPGKAAKAGKATKNSKPAKVAKVAKTRGARAPKATGADGVTITLSEAFDLLGDELSLAVHRADKKQRTIIAAILGG